MHGGSGIGRVATLLQSSQLGALTSGLKLDGFQLPLDSLLHSLLLLDLFFDLVDRFMKVAQRPRT